MNIDIKTIIVMIFFAVALVHGVISISRLSSKNRYKKISMITARVLLITLLALGSAGLDLKLKSHVNHTVFLVDRSASMRGSVKAIEEFINDSLTKKTSSDKVSVISFGSDEAVDYSPAFEMAGIDLTSVIDDRGSSYEAGLNKALSMIKDNENGRIVMISDGYENMDDYNRISSKLISRNIEFKYAGFDKFSGPDSQISGLTVPKKTSVGEKFQISMEIYSTDKTEGTVKIFKGNRLFAENKVNLAKGSNQFYFTDYLESSGQQLYSAVLETNDGGFAQNDKFTVMTEAVGSPRVLIVENSEGSGALIAKFALDHGYKVDLVDSSEAPVEVATLMTYQGVILANVTLEDTPNQFIDNLKVYVSDYGGGLMVTGGNKSYALGGYYETTLEEILPVNMEMKRDKMLPAVNMVLVIDHSGSMDGDRPSKLEMSKEAARKAVAALKPNDKIGVLAFDDTRTWVSRLQGADNKEDIISSIGQIGVGGGTAIVPALRDAIDELAQSDSELKHIILLTDGYAEQVGYEPLIDRAKENKITISTIAVGMDSDVRLLDTIATKAEGRAYVVKNAENIPEIFTKEAFLASKSYINEETFTPIITSDSSILSPFGDSIASVDGYVSTSLKQGSELLLMAQEKEPLLAIRHYGMGMSTAWTSDFGGKWSAGFISDMNSQKMMLNLLERTLRSSSNEDINISTEVNGSSVDIVAGKGELSTALVSKELQVVGEDGTVYDIDGTSFGDDFVKGKIENLKEGVYIIKAKGTDDGGIVQSSSPFVVNYSKEFDIDGVKDVSVDMIKAFGGYVIVSSDEIFEKMDSKVYDSVDISKYLLILALFIFILDIYVRRFRDDKLTAIIETVSLKLGHMMESASKTRGKKQKSYPKKNSSSSEVKSKTTADEGQSDGTSNVKLNVESKSTSKKIQKTDKTGNKKSESQAPSTDHLSQLLKAKDRRK